MRIYTTTYNYGSRGELLSVSLPDGRFVEYVHDPLGRRIAKKIDGVIVEKYLWQGLTRLLAVYDGAANLLMRFEYADGRMPVAMVKNGIRYYLNFDQVGSLRTIADTAGNVVKRIDYDAFGNILTDSDPAFSIPFGFAGGLHDRDTGLVRFGYRDYDPDTGRWTAKDPIFFDGGDTDLYGYVLNDPLNLVDSFGLYLTHSQKLKVSFISGAGSTIGGILGGGMIGSAAGGAISGAVAAASMGGSTMADVANSFVSGFISGAIGASFASLVKASMMYGMKAAITTGAFTGMLDAILLEAEPLIKESRPCSKN